MHKVLIDCVMLLDAIVRTFQCEVLENQRTPSPVKDTCKLGKLVDIIDDFHSTSLIKRLSRSTPQQLT